MAASPPADSSSLAPSPGNAPKALRSVPPRLRSIGAGDDSESASLSRSSSQGSVYSLRSFLSPSLVGNSDSNENLAELPSLVEAAAMAAGELAKSEVVAGWALSLKNLLIDRNGAAAFLKYCEQLLCEENLMFWHAVEVFKTADDEDLQGIGKEIYDEFILFSGKHQVNLNSKTAKTMKAAYKEPPLSRDVYDACQTEIFELMKTDSYRKFIQSDAYKELALLEQECKPLPWEGRPSSVKRKKGGFLSFLRKEKKKAPILSAEGECLSPLSKRATKGKSVPASPQLSAR